MRSFHVKIGDREEGPFTEPEVAQIFANGRVDRNTPCKPSDHGDWKTIDDYLPMLKYGTQLPPATKVPAIPPAPAPALPSSQRVSVIDFDSVMAAATQTERSIWPGAHESKQGRQRVSIRTRNRKQNQEARTTGKK